MNRASMVAGRLRNLWLPGDDADNIELPRHYGYSAWTGRPAAASANTNPGSGVLILTKLYVARAMPITNLTVYVGTAGASLTAGENFLGLYTSAGVLIGTTADQSAAWAAAPGQKPAAALVGGPYTPNAGNAEDFWVWAGLLANGTTTPSFANETAATALLNFNLSAANSRSCSTGSGLTSLPASFNPAGVAPWNHAIFVATS